MNIQNPELEPIDAAKVFVATAMARVWKRFDGISRSAILDSLSEVAREREIEPLTFRVQVEGDFEMGLHFTDDPSFDGSRLEMMNAALRVWYKVLGTDRAMVFEAIRDLAHLKDLDQDEAILIGYTVVDTGQTSADADAKKPSYSEMVSKQSKVAEAQEAAARAKRLANEKSQHGKRYSAIR